MMRPTDGRRSVPPGLNVPAPVRRRRRPASGIGWRPRRLPAVPHGTRDATMTGREATMPNADLARRLRDYARGPGRAAVVVSSAWLAREFGVDPRTIAAALRPYGVQPGEVERGVRGYSTAELAGMVLPGDEPDVALPDGWRPVDAVDVPDAAVNHWSSGMTGEEVAAQVALGNVEVPLSALLRADEAEALRAAGVDPDSAVAVLSAAAGHDISPALRAAGLL